jgi:hypothetical protein
MRSRLRRSRRGLDVGGWPAVLDELGGALKMLRAELRLRGEAGWVEEVLAEPEGVRVEVGRFRGRETSRSVARPGGEPSRARRQDGEHEDDEPTGVLDLVCEPAAVALE